MSLDTSRFKMRETKTHVYFWGGPASQWYLGAPFRQRFTADGDVFKFNCAEQYMMAGKARMFDDAASFTRIMAASTPVEQKRLGRLVEGFDLTTWEAAVPDVLVRANLAKFSQNPDILEWLISTTGKRIVEGSPSDRIYGVGLSYDDPRIESPANWRGRNLLGSAIETVRDRLSRALVVGQHHEEHLVPERPYRGIAEIRLVRTGDTELEPSFGRQREVEPIKHARGMRR